MSLSSSDRRLLKQKAHHLKPLAFVGKDGITEKFAKEVSQTLLDHELVKIKVNFNKEDRDLIAEELITKTRSILVAIVGNVLILFKLHPDPKKRKLLELPVLRPKRTATKKALRNQSR